MTSHDKKKHFPKAIQVYIVVSKQKVFKTIDSSDGKGAIYLGNIYAAYSVELLKRNNITAVLTIAAGTQLKYREELGIM